MRTRKNYSTEQKKEIATGYYQRTLSAKEIEARGIRMNNVHRWVQRFFGPGGRAKGGEPAPEAPAPAPVTVQSLSLKKLRRGPNGRYPSKDKATVMAALLESPVSEVSQKTGVDIATLYVWKKAAEKSKPGTAINGSSEHPVEPPKSALGPTNGARPPVVAKAEVIINPDTTASMLNGLDKMEGFVNFKKTVENKLRNFRAGLIDFDAEDHRLCMAYLQITGERTVRSRK